MRKKRYFSILFDFFLEWKTSKKKLKYYFFFNFEYPFRSSDML